MTTVDRFDRRLGDLLEDLGGWSYPSYFEAALEHATGLPQRRHSILDRLRPRPVIHGELIARRAMGLVAAAIVGGLLLALIASGFVGGPEETLAPGPTPTDAAQALPENPCPGHASVDGIDPGQHAWAAGNPASLPSQRPGPIAAFATNLVDAAVTVVLVDPETGVACRLVELGATDGPRALLWSPTGEALAISTGTALYIWTERGLIEPRRQELGGTGPQALSWVPSGTILAVGRVGELLILTDSGVLQSIAAKGVSQMAWSPDGGRLAVAAVDEIDGSLGLAIVSRVGEQLDAIEPAPAVLPVGWLDANTLVAGDVIADGPYQALDVPSQTWTTWSAGAVQPFSGGSTIGLAPNLAGVAIVATTGQDGDPRDMVIRSLPAGVNQVLAVGVKPSGVLSSGTWSPDSLSIALALDGGSGAPATGLWIYPVDGGVPRQISRLALELSNGSWQPVEDTQP